MLASLKFVQGAIRRNAIDPTLEHYRIGDGRISGSNGHMTLSAKVELDLVACPKASTFYRAIDACKESLSLSMTPAGRLAVVSQGFRAYVPCVPDMPFISEPQGEIVPVPQGFVADLIALLPFIGEDASRPWAMGLLVRDGQYMATNNIVLVQRWSGHSMPAFNFPRFAVTELARIGVDPTHIQATSDSVTFHYADGRWLKTQLYPNDWPFERMSELLDRPHAAKTVDDILWDAVDGLKPFMDEKSSAVYFRDGELATSTAELDGVVFEVPGVIAGPIFSIHQLRLLRGVAEKLDLTMFPAPCLFFGERTRGVVIGMTG